MKAILLTVAAVGFIAAGQPARASFESLPARPVKDSLQPLIQADWIAREGGWDLKRTREVLRRGRLLARRSAAMPRVRGLDTLLSRVDDLEAQVNRLAAGPAPDEARQKALFFEACSVVRQIAFCNPRLREIKRLLFITRHDAKGEFHMVDQFYGFNARPGGRLLVLVDPFGSSPKLVDLLARSVVENGRLKGRRLEGGAFLSPEVSFDGRTVLFAWTQAQGRNLEWSPRASYHIFRVQADGTGLRQLTDGPWDDFDPCFLPSGRVVFISERRGGYLRCGRHCPTYTMFGMTAGGEDIICLSFHETHEWQPSILPDGRIVYTRWDYVDRDTNIAHHPWTCRPDGSDPRAIHGNYPVRRESRPWMEMDIRAVPGSRKLVAVAAAHHGHAFGSLVLIDPEVEDDRAMSPLTRLTPEVPFPEAEKHLRPIRECMVYGTPWPLSEEDYLCVYDAKARNRGIYWIDRFGNRELIYRDPAISCLSPMPLQPRPRPPVILPDATLARVETADATPIATPTPTPASASPGSPTAGQPATKSRPPHSAKPDGIAGRATATVAVMNVYDSDFDWPKGVRIHALRVIQLLPKSTPPPNQPRIGVADQTNARAVLGTAPVEPDGSAYFQVPAGVPIYFQALDADGLAVQSMRSVTYARPGQRLMCAGCHEPRTRAPRLRTDLPLALRRPPSPLTPGPAGSNPFSFVRLVQPVLDQYCVDCHRQRGALDLSGTIEGPHGWTRSYNNLAGRYGFYFHVSNGSINTGIHGGSRTVPGRFGARASALLPLLSSRHYGLNLPDEAYHRITLWLDCNSEFYGAYEQTAAQARGEIVYPSLQ